MSTKLKSFAFLAILLLMATMTAVFQPASFVLADRTDEVQSPIGAAKISSNENSENVGMARRVTAPVFEDGFESGSFAAHWSTNATLPAVVEVSSDDPYSGQSHAFIGKQGTGDGVAELILSVDLSQQAQEELLLDFWWHDTGSGHDSDSGIFVRDDPSKKWHKVFTFNDASDGDVPLYRHELIYLNDLLAGTDMVFNEQFQIRFYYDQYYESRVDGYVIDEVKLLTYSEIPASFPFQDSFESDTLASHWYYSPSCGGLAEVDNDDPYSGTRSLFIGKRGETSCRSAVNMLLPIDLSQQAQEELFLDFWWHDTGSRHDSNSGIFVRDDPSKAWHRVFTFNEQSNGDVPLYHHELIYLNDLLAGTDMVFNEQFQIRFHYYEYYDSRVNGYMIDDVKLLTRSEILANLPFQDGFESNTWHNNWYYSPSCGGLAEVTTEDPHSGNSSLFMGKRANSSCRSVVEMTLPIDLTGEQGVSLDFWWRDEGSQLSNDNGIFVSDDDGQSWRKIFTFNDVGNTPKYRHEQIDLDETLAGSGLRYNDRFQIRFYYYQYYDSRVNSYMIDDIRITSKGSPLPDSVHRVYLPLLTR